MMVIGVRLPEDLVAKLKAFSARRSMSVSTLCRHLLVDSVGRLVLPPGGPDAASAELPKPVLERLLAGVLCCEELAIRQLHGDKNRAAILSGIEKRVVDQVNKLMDE
jgi:hypothetical protein